MAHCSKKLDIDILNDSDEAAASGMILPFIERAPAVAAQVARMRPFAGPEHLADAIREAIFGLEGEDLLALFQGHPVLAPAAPDDMTEASRDEQGRLGIADPATEIENRLADLNRRYIERFGFPFIIALHKHGDTKSVITDFERRLAASREDEIATAREEIASVSRARILAASGREDTVKAGGVSIHAVDVASGRPARGLAVRLLRCETGGEIVLASGQCGESGLFDHPTVRGEGILAGRYVAEFAVQDFYSAGGRDLPQPGFLDVVRFHFGIADVKQHYHLPFKFTAWGYSLFRGGL